MFTTFLPGTKFLFQVAIQVLYHNQAQLMMVQDDGEAMSLLNEFTENVSNKDSPFQTVREVGGAVTSLVERHTWT